VILAVWEGLAQMKSYADRCRVDEAHLVLFDRTPDTPWSRKIFRRIENGKGVPSIFVWGM